MLEGWTRRGNRDEDRRNSALPNQSPKCSAGLAMDSMSRTSAALCPFFKVPSLPKHEVDSSLAEKPFLRPSLARGGLRFPVSARRHRLQAPLGAPVSGGKNPVPNSKRTISTTLSRIQKFQGSTADNRFLQHVGQTPTAHQRCFSVAIVADSPHAGCIDLSDRGPEKLSPVYRVDSDGSSSSERSRTAPHPATG